MLYPWLLFLHITGIIGFMLAHGASASASFALQRERNVQRIRALLSISTSSFGLMYASLVLLLVSGIIAGIIGTWFSHAWIWISLVLLIAISAAMGILGSRIYTPARKAAGLPYFEGNKPHPAGEPASPEELYRALEKGKPALLAAIGFGGTLVIAWLMIFKPF